MKNILIIDDEDYICKLIEKIANKKGYTSYKTNTYLDGLNLLLNNDIVFDYIFLDYNVEKNKIAEFSKIVKQKNKDAKIYIMSGFEKENLNINGLCDGYIYKPELVESINKIFQ